MDSVENPAAGARPIEKFERAFVAVNTWLLLVLMTVMSLVVFANVVLRYTTDFSITWAEEMARYCMIWMTFLGAGLVLRLGGHVAITNLPDALPARGGRVLRGLVAAILFLFFCVMIWIGWDYMHRMQFQITPALRLRFSYIYAAIPAGFALMAIHLFLVVRSYVFDNRFVESADEADQWAARG